MASTPEAAGVERSSGSSLRGIDWLRRLGVAGWAARTATEQGAPVRLRFTPAGTFTLVAAGAILLSALNTANNLLYLLAALLFAAALPVSVLIAARTLTGLRAELLAPEEVRRGATADIAVRLESDQRRGGAAAVVVEVRGGAERATAVVAWLPAGERRALALRLPTTRRGRLPIALTLVTPFPFGLFLAVRRALVEAEVLVLPACEDGEERPSARAAGHDGTPSQRRGRGHDLLEIRDYRPGDDARSIHWKATARLSRPMMREHARDEERRATVIVDPSIPEGPREPAVDSVERAISRAAGLIERLDHEGWTLRLLTPAREHQGTARELLRALALLPLVEAPMSSDWWTRIPVDEPHVVFRAESPPEGVP